MYSFILQIWIWPRTKFLHRKDLMDEMYWKFMDEGESKKHNIEKEKDPFWDPVEDIFLGRYVFEHKANFNI